MELLPSTLESKVTVTAVSAALGTLPLVSDQAARRYWAPQTLTVNHSSCCHDQSGLFLMHEPLVVLEFELGPSH